MQGLQSNRIGPPRLCWAAERRKLGRLIGIRSIGFPIESSHRPPIGHYGHLICSAPSSSATAAALTADEPEKQYYLDFAELHSSGLLKVLRHCRTTFAILAGLAAWLYLSSGPSTSGPFASVVASATHAGAGGNSPMQRPWDLSLDGTCCTRASCSKPQPLVVGVELAAKSAWTGLATGVFHTLCGPDHLAVG